MSNAFTRRMERLEQGRSGGNPLRQWSDARLDARLRELAPRALADPTMAEHYGQIRFILDDINGGQYHG